MFCRLAKNVKLAHKETNYKSFLKYLNGINTGYDNVFGDRKTFQFGLAEQCTITNVLNTALLWLNS